MGWFGVLKQTQQQEVSPELPARVRPYAETAGQYATAGADAGRQYVRDVTPTSRNKLLEMNRNIAANQGNTAEENQARRDEQARYSEYMADKQRGGVGGLWDKMRANQSQYNPFSRKPHEQYMLNQKNIQDFREQEDKNRERDEMADEATARAAQAQKPMGGEYDALLEAAGRLPQPAEQQPVEQQPVLDDTNEVNPAFVEEAQTARDVLEEQNRGLSQEVQEQLQDPSSTQSTDWQGEVRDDGQATFGSSIVTDGSQESPAAKAAREAREKAQAKQPKGKQTKLGRNLKGHWLPDYGGSKNVAAVHNLERTKNVREGMADKRKKEQESTSGKQAGLGDFS
tara:strand:- start:25 stop:1047 length:1023 start_codon:yes stop_codon:yes gene_type:complete